MDAVLQMIQEHWSSMAVAGGPLAASIGARIIFPGNKAMAMLVRGAAAWLVIKVLIGPMMDLVRQYVTQLIQITSR